MAMSTRDMEYAARAFADLWVDENVDTNEALNRVRPLYRDNAIFISPNPPKVSPEFGTTLNGRDEIMKYHEACMKLFPSGSAITQDIIFGINMAIWIYEAKLTNMVMADVLLFDENGLIETQRVTSGGLDS